MDFAEKLANKLGELFALQEERTRSQIAAGMVETRNALRLRGARAVPVVGSQLVNAGPARLVGWSLRAVGGAATVTLVDARDAYSDGDVLATVLLGADGATSNHAMPGGGISVTEAAFLVVTGAATSLAGAIYLGATD